MARTCSCGCGAELPEDEPGAGGRPRLYLNAAHRTRACRRRREAAAWIPAVDVTAIHLHGPADPETQIAQSIVELAAIAGTMRALSTESSTPPPLAASCELVFLGIVDLLTRYFPGWSR